MRSILNPTADGPIRSTNFIRSIHIQTNCPENVGFDLKTNFILLNGHDFEKIDTNLMKDLIDNPYGVLQMYYSEDAKNFEAKNVES